MRFEVTTLASPEQVRAALTDFTDRRLHIWNRTLDPKTYEVRAVGDTWAVARESTAGSPFWVVSRCDWADPTVLRWTVEESSWGGSGTGSVRIAPVDGGGSRVHAEWTYTGASRTRDKVMLSLIQRFPLRRMIARGWVKALDRYAQSDLA
jgi:Polyketide cyclase / dehydrase and lipid transport